MKIRGYLIRVAYFATLALFVSGAWGAADRNTELSASKNREAVILKYIRLVAVPNNYVVRFYFYHECRVEGWSPVLFPAIDLNSIPSSITESREMQDWPTGHENVDGSSASPRIMRLVIGDVPNDILETNIPYVSLSSLEQYNPILAISALLRVDDVKSAMADNHVYVAPVPVVKSLVQPAKNLPKLPKHMKNVTVDEALDQVALTFKGIVIYGECRKDDGSNVIDVYFKPI